MKGLYCAISAKTVIRYKDMKELASNLNAAFASKKTIKRDCTKIFPLIHKRRLTQRWGITSLNYFKTKRRKCFPWKCFTFLSNALSCPTNHSSGTLEFGEHQDNAVFSSQPHINCNVDV